MEKQLFTWESWDQLDTMCFSFINCTLVAPVGMYVPGEKFACITMDYEHGIIQIWNGDKKFHEYKLTLNVS